MLRREREEGLGYGYGSCVETGECTVPCYVVWRVRELEYYCRNCSVFPDREFAIEVGRVVIRSRGDGQHRHRELSGIHSPPGTSPGPTAAPQRRREARRDNRYASSAPAARACRLRGLVAAERNELRSMGASGSLGLCHLQSVDDVCHQPSVNQTVYR